MKEEEEDHWWFYHIGIEDAPGYRAYFVRWETKSVDPLIGFTCNVPDCLAPMGEELSVLDIV